MVSTLTTGKEGFQQQDPSYTVSEAKDSTELWMTSVISIPICRQIQAST